MCSLGCPQTKLRKFDILSLRERPPQYLNNTLQHPMTTNIRHAAAGSCCSLMVQKSRQEIVQFGEGRETRLKIYD